MPSINLPALENELAKRAVTAVAAGATTYIRPARFPKWVRRSVSMSNTLASVGLAMAGDRRPGGQRLENGQAQDVVEVANGVTVPRTGANWASAAAAGMGLVTSGLALKVDARVEKALLKRGVPNPRLIMAVGAAGLSLASPWISRAAHTVGAKLQEKAAAHPALQSTLAGAQSQHAAATDQLGPGVTLSSGGNDEQEQSNKSQQHTDD